MFSELLATKLHVPPIRTEHIKRQRLTKFLVQVLSHKLGLISAPAGFGKTTYISGGLIDLERPFSWLTIDEQDNDPSRFISYLIAALQNIDLDIGQQIEGVVHSPQVLPLTATITVLLNDIAELPTYFVIVLDDYHLLQTAECHLAIDLLLKYSPPQMHMA